MKRATGLKILTGLFKRHYFIDEFDEINTV